MQLFCEHIQINSIIAYDNAMHNIHKIKHRKYTLYTQKNFQTIQLATEIPLGVKRTPLSIQQHKPENRR